MDDGQERNFDLNQISATAYPYSCVANSLREEAKMIPSHYVEQAKKLREMAAECAGSQVSMRWLATAEEYEKLANQMSPAKVPPPKGTERPV